MTITTIIWDFAGVIADSRMWPRVAELLAKRYGVEPKEVSEACYGDEEGIMHGRESLLVFWARTIRPLGISYADLLWAMTHWYSLDEFLLGFIESLDDYTHVILSDSFPGLADSIRRERRLANLFDAMFFSNELHLTKLRDGEEIFTHVLETLDADPQECIFIDDKQHNLPAPKSMGITTILHESTPKTLAAIRKAL